MHGLALLLLCLWPFLKMHLSVFFRKEVIVINHDCLPILMLLYIMLYIMLAFLMLFAALFSCFFLPLIFANAFCFHALSWFIDT